MTGEEGGEGGEGEGGEGEENCHPLITSLLNEGAVIKIRNNKQITFKNLVNKKIKELAHCSLLENKKGKLINLSDDYCMQEYLTTDKITLAQKQILFNLRTRMIPVRSNYKNQYPGNLNCTLCDTNSEESQEHLIQCPALLERVDVDSSVKYMDIFDTLEKQVKAVKYISEILKIRKSMLKTQENEHSQVRNHVHS